MLTHKSRPFDRLARLLAVFCIALGAIGLAPASQLAQAAPSASPQLAPALGLLPSPVPTINVNTTAILNSTSDGKCDLWEALQAAVYADISNVTSYNECSAALGGKNVIGFIGPAAGATIQLPSSLLTGTLPFVWGDLTVLGPITIKPSAALTDTHIFQTAGDAIFTLIGVTLTGAHTSGSGAAILDQNHATLNIIGSSFSNNTADNTGGAIDSNGNVNISLSNFSTNTALGVGGGEGYGGALYVKGSGNLTIAKSNFLGNVAKAGGGALYSTLGYATIEDSLFTGNVAGQVDNLLKGGGAIFNDVNGALGIARTEFTANLTPQGNGGAIFNNSGAGIAISDTTFAANVAGDLSHIEYGGAIYNQAYLTIQRSSFVNNVSPQGHGGALAVDRAGTADIANTTFGLNTTPNGFGAAIIITQTQQGGPASSLTARNVTIAFNVAAVAGGGGIYNAAGQNLHLGNTLLSDNSAGIGLQNCAGSGNLDNLGHNLDSGTTCNIGNGNGNQSSGSADLGGPSFNGGALASMLTMKPDVGSDAIDKGDNAICATTIVNNEDQRGDTRPKDGSHFGTNYCDVGAFEADAAKAGFGSQPSEPGPIDVGNAVVNAGTVTTTLVISNTGEWPLDILNIALTGANPGDFSVSPTPISIIQHSAPVSLVISCTPHGSAGARSALLGFATSDTPLHAVVGFLLKCNGYNSPKAGYGSVPIAPGPITFPDTQAFGGSSDVPFKVVETGDTTLNITSMTVGGLNSSEFQILTSASFSIANGGAASTVALRCLPTDYGLRTAILTVHTDDPDQGVVTYNLTCKGVPPPSPALLTNGGSVGNTPQHGLNGAYGVAVSPDNKYVYVTSPLSGSVSSFKRNTVTGALTFVGQDAQSFPICCYTAGAQLLAETPDGRSVFIAGYTTPDVALAVPNALTGELDSFPHGGTGGALGGAYGVAVSNDGRFVYITGHTGNSVVQYNRDAVTNNLSWANHDVVSAANLGGAYGLDISPDGQNVYVAGATNGTVEVLKRNAADGSLTHVQTRKQTDTIDGTPLTGLAGASQLVVSPDGHNVYVVSTNDNKVVQFARNLADGKLTWLGSFGCGCGAVNGLLGGSGIDITPDGLHVFASGFAGDAVVAFDRNPDTGVLTFNQEVTKSGNGLPLDGASDLRVSPDGHTVYVAAYLDDAIVTLPIANPVPFVNNISPASAPQGSGAFTLHIYGANFFPGSHAGSFVTTFINSNQLDVTIPASALASTGPQFIQVVNPQPIGDNTYSIPFYLQVIPPADNPIPSIDHLTPQGGLAGGSALTLDVFGTNFIASSSVRWNGTSRATTFVNSTHLQAAIAQSDVSQPGVSNVTVFNGTPGGDASNGMPYTVAQPGGSAAPSATSVNPPWVFSLGAASKQVQVIVTGQNFIDGSIGQVDGADRTTDFIDSSHLKVTLYGSDLLAPGSVGITIVTPAPGGGTSNTLVFGIRKLYRLLIPLTRR